MFASVLFSTEAEAREFRDRLEQLLRQGQPDRALAELEDLMARLNAPDHPIARLIVEAAEAQIDVAGWSELGARIAALDTPEAPVTAIGIDISNTCHNGGAPDADRLLDPYIETNFYKDDAFPFSTAGRTALLAGYSNGGSQWQGCFADIDNTIEVHGLAALYGALDAHHVSDAFDSPLDYDLFVIGKIYVAIRLHLAVVEAVLHGGLPRPLTVLVGSNEDFPYFDAPVVTAGEYREHAPHQVQEAPVCEDAVETKEDVFEDIEEPAAAFEASDEPEDEALHLPDPAHHVSGLALRRRAQQSEAQAAARVAPDGPSGSNGLLNRLFRRK